MRLALALVLLAGCAAEPTARLGEEPAAEAEPAGDAYGDPIDDSIELTSLGSIVDEPDRFADRVVRTEGQIARVCQQAGCWMELREGEDGPAVRVPMAGHAFFLPRDSAGRHATMQGRVVIQALAADVREHLESEGAVETGSSLAIHATGVVID